MKLPLMLATWVRMVWIIIDEIDGNIRKKNNNITMVLAGTEMLNNVQKVLEQKLSVRIDFEKNDTKIDIFGQRFNSLT